MASPDSSAPIVITGGAQRLGLAAAKALREQGYPVVITYRRERPLLEKLRAEGIETIRADFGEDGGAAALARELKRRYRSLRALVHNASEWLPEGGGRDPAELLQRMLQVHVQAPYLLNLECGDLLRRHGEQHGCADIIHMSDYVASTGSSKHIAYAASKAALDNLTLSFASKFAPTVKVNSIAPALLLFNEGDGPEYRARALAKSLIPREAGLAELMAAVDYLMNSRYVTGRILHLDGGRHLR